MEVVMEEMAVVLLDKMVLEVHMVKVAHKLLEELEDHPGMAILCPITAEL